MGTLWFWIVALMLTAYVVFDGFDLGIGIVYLFVARTETERVQTCAPLVRLGRQRSLAAAAGGTLSSRSRFSMPRIQRLLFPLMMVLWLLILRGSASSYVPLRRPTLAHFLRCALQLLKRIAHIFFGAAMAMLCAAFR